MNLNESSPDLYHPSISSVFYKNPLFYSDPNLFHFRSAAVLTIIMVLDCS